MWGNRLGWSISIVIAAVVLSLLARFVHEAGITTAPTEFSRDPKNLAALNVPFSPSKCLEMNDPGDAGELYRHAIELYRDDPQRYERFAASGLPETLDERALPALEPILQATTCSTAHIFVDQPASVIGYSSDNSSLEILRSLGAICAERLGYPAVRAGRAEFAKPYLHAAFALGAKLFEERLTADELSAGLALMSAAALSMREIESSPALESFEKTRAVFFQQQIMPTLHILRTIDPQTMAQHAGDVFVLATQSRERMWRIEAILALGRMRYFIGDAHASDQRAARRLLRKLSSDADPSIRAAAIAARQLTPEQYRALGR